MILSFRHKGLKRFFETGNAVGIQTSHVQRLRAVLRRLDVASSAQDMNIPGWRLHALKGDLQGHHSVWVSGNWRLTFRFIGVDVELVDYRDYH